MTLVVNYFSKTDTYCVWYKQIPYCIATGKTQAEAEQNLVLLIMTVKVNECIIPLERLAKFIREK